MSLRWWCVYLPGYSRPVVLPAPTEPQVALVAAALFGVNPDCDFILELDSRPLTVHPRAWDSYLDTVYEFAATVRAGRLRAALRDSA